VSASPSDEPRGAGPTTLVVYNLLTSTLRQTNLDHLNAFRQFGTGRCYYLNLAVRDVPAWLRKIDFDAVIYTTSFLGQRWTPALFDEQRERVRSLMGVGRARIATPQDEFLRTAMLSDFIEEFRLNHVVSVSPSSEWPKIYEGVDFDRVGFTQALTGYLADPTVRKIDEIVARTPERDLDIGYRARPGAPWLGRHGILKGEVGAAFTQAARERGMSFDISSDDDDVLVGDDWFRFLARSRYTIGIEGGASILDREGRFKEATEAYLREHPNASFDEIERECFPGEDGKLRLFAISPRHLEACATRTCQVLVEGDYNGILRPGEHYIELRRDLSNLEQVLDLMADDSERAAITERAYRDVVASGRYSYRSYVREIEDVIAGIAAPYAPQGSGLKERARHAAARATDRASWTRVGLVGKPRPTLHRIMRTVLPIRVLYFVRKRLYGPAVAHRMTYG
jgi:hypothetical protein